jgi:hypothetical protein
MSRRNWKSYRPISLLDALRACKDFAAERRSLSVERIADLMGITPDLLYKWLATGRMPAVLVPTYELVCGASFVSDWLAHSAGKLTMAIPAGRAEAADVQALQGVLHEAVGALIAFYAGQKDEESTQARLLAGMEALAWHRQNVGKFEQPELAL